MFHYVDDRQFFNPYVSMGFLTCIQASTNVLKV